MVSPRPTRTGWSNIVSPYSLTGTSAAVNTATTPGAASRRAGVHRHHAGVRLAGEHHPGVEHVVRAQVGRVAGGAGDLAVGVARTTSGPTDAAVRVIAPAACSTASKMR